MTTICKVCIPNTLNDFFDYEALEYPPCIGARVWVPFRQQKKLGIVIGYNDPSIAHRRLKAISAVIDEQSLISEHILALCRWIARYYQSPLSEVLPLALPKKYRLGARAELPKITTYYLTCTVTDALQQLPARALKKRLAIEYLAQHPGATKALLTQQGITSTIINALLEVQLINAAQEIIPAKTTTHPLQLAPLLHLEQEQAVAVMQKHLHHFYCFLLHGVTGSGKTEVYLQIIAQVLAQKKQVLVLVPEIGLTPQLVARFTQRITQPIAVIHSHLNESERQIAWQQAQEQQVQIIIGTRAAIFTPLPQLGLIIIDEEHDASFKQMDGVRYSARDSALMRAHMMQIPIILGSATPCLESIYNCQQKKYHLLRLQHKAISTTPLHYQLIDLRAQPLHHGLTSSALQVIDEHLQQQKQVLVFINRRGFAPVLLCHQCGWMHDCRACDSHLTMHKQLGKMICHHCGLIQSPPYCCPKCQSTELIPVGAGTQRIHQYLQATFPKTRVVRIDRDETRKKNALAMQLDSILSGEAQLIVGTQMLAKGHHFPSLSLVVILDADAGFYNQDFRATEHLGQLLTQVAGRAGRANEAGHVLIQTHLPHHPLLNVLIQQGYDAFAEELLVTRQQASLPPYHFLALVRVKSKSLNAVTHFLLRVKEFLAQSSLTTMGPAPAPLARKADQHRMQLLIKSSSRQKLQTTLTELRQWVTLNKLGTNVRWNIDVDPMDLS